MEKYNKTATTATNIKTKNQHNDEVIIINNIIEELDKKRDIAINKKKKALLNEVSIYRLEENTPDYILFIIRRELTGKLY